MKLTKIQDVFYSGLYWTFAMKRSTGSSQERHSFSTVIWLVALVLAAMALLNVFTGNWPLMLADAVSSLLLYGLHRLNSHYRQSAVIKTMFFVTLLALFSGFIIWGGVNGFAVIWLLVLPPVAFASLGPFAGFCVCLVLLLELLFFFYSGYGRSLLAAEYSYTFLTRFPIVYLSSTLFSLYIELDRNMSWEALKSSMIETEYYATHDILTGVLNRYGYNEHIDSLLAAGTEDNPVAGSVMIIDVDYFKKINDSYGHLVGDVVLKDIAQLILKNIGDRGTVCRWGGEEFAVFLPEAESYSVHLERAERIRRIVAENELTAEGVKICVTITVGLMYCLTITPGNIAMIVKEADNCMYQGKEAGRNTVIGRNCSQFSSSDLS